MDDVRLVEIDKTTTTTYVRSRNQISEKSKGVEGKMRLTSRCQVIIRAEDVKSRIWADLLSRADRKYQLAVLRMQPVVTQMADNGIVSIAVSHIGLFTRSFRHHRSDAPSLSQKSVLLLYHVNLW